MMLPSPGSAKQQFTASFNGESTQDLGERFINSQTGRLRGTDAAFQQDRLTPVTKGIVPSGIENLEWLQSAITRVT